MVRLNIFLSSTFDELKNERASIKKILDPEDFDVFLFEDAGARSESSRQVYSEEVLNCDIYIGIFKEKYSKPTEEEYRIALSNKKEILTYIHSDSINREEKLKILLEEIEKHHKRDKFPDLESLKFKVKHDVYELLKRKFREPVINYNGLYRYGIRLITKETSFRDGDIKCWKIGYFTEEDIRNNFDARRPITDLIINSSDNNHGTVLFGRSHYGKSVILQRAMFEEVTKDKAVVVIEDLKNRASILKEIFLQLRARYKNILVVVDDVHRSGSEELFKAFNDLSDDELSTIHFLFSAKEERFTILKNSLSFKDSTEIELALRNMKIFNLGFDVNDALIILKKAYDVSSIEYGDEKNIITLARNLFRLSHGDPFIFFSAVMYHISANKVEMEKSITDFIQRDIKEKRAMLESDRQLSLSLLCSFINIFGMKISPDVVARCGYFLDDLKLLSGKGLLFKNSHFKTRHELWATEFIAYVLENEFENDIKGFNSRYRVDELFACMLDNMKLDELYNIIDTCVILTKNNRHQYIGKLVINNVKSHNLQNLSRGEMANFYCYGLGTYYLLTNNYKNAANYYQNTLDIDTKHEAWNNKGTVHYILREYEKALESFNKILDTYPKHQDALNNKALTLIRLHRYSESLTISNISIEINPLSSRFWNNKGISLFHLGHYKDAIVSFEKAIELDPENANGYDGKGLCLHRLEYYNDAVDNFEKAIELDPESADILAHKGDSLLELKEFIKSLECYDEAIKRDPKHVHALFNKGSLLEHHFENLTDALKCFEIVTQVSPRSWDVWVGKGQVLHGLGRLTEALDCFDRAISINATVLLPWLIKGQILCELNKQVESLYAYDQATKIDSTNSLAWENKGLVAYGLKEYQTAFSPFDKYLSINPNNHRIWYKRAAVRLKNSDISGCLNDLREAIKINKDEVIEGVVNDPDFQDLVHNEEFKKLVHG